MKGHLFFYRITVLQEPDNFPWKTIHKINNWVQKVQFNDKYTLKLSSKTLVIYLKGYFEADSVVEINNQTILLVNEIKLKLEKDGFVFADTVVLASKPNIYLPMAIFGGKH